MTSPKFSRPLFGERIRRLREEKGWTQKDLAAHVGGWDSKISSWESGIPPRDPADLIALADLLGCSVDYLLTGREAAGLDKIIGGLEGLLVQARQLSMGSEGPEEDLPPDQAARDRQA